MRISMMLVMASAWLAAPAEAGQTINAEAALSRTGYHAIAAGDLAAATRELEAQRRIFPARPELMLNLAAVYAHTGRIAEARELYDRVLRRPAVAMDMPDGSILPSHVVAARGAARLGLQPEAKLATR